MEVVFSVRHQSQDYPVKFGAFTTKFEAQLGRFDYRVYESLESDPASARTKLEAMAGAHGMMLFSIQEHGKLLNLFGKGRAAKQYLLGNPLIAIQMTQHDIRAALYAPLRLLAYENATGGVTVEYDLPSSLFGSFKHPAIDDVALGLDRKLQALIEAAAK